MITPIFETSIFDYPNPSRRKERDDDVDDPLIYTRYRNPTQHEPEDKIAALEGGEKGLVFSSGLAAISTALLTFLKAGDSILTMSDLYGGTHMLMKDHLSKVGIEVTFLQKYDVEDFAGGIRENTKIIYVESPTNPLLKIIDIPALAELKEGKGIMLMVDNTFATPINHNPLSLGADIVVHSATKYLNGHSDLVAGLAVGRMKEMNLVKEKRKIMGCNLDPIASFLLARGMKTLALRMERQNRSAFEIAKFLEGHPKVKKVYYPGLESHPQHGLAKKLMRGFGGMVTFEIDGGKEAADSFLSRIRIAKATTSLGGVETLVSLPVDTSQKMLSPEEREAIGVNDSLVRVSVGIEDVEDLKRDFGEALG